MILFFWPKLHLFSFSILDAFLNILLVLIRLVFSIPLLAFNVYSDSLCFVLVINFGILLFFVSLAGQSSQIFF